MIFLELNQKRNQEKERSLNDAFKNLYNSDAQCYNVIKINLYD